MNTILGVAELLAQGNLSAEQRRQVEMLQRAGTRLIAVVDRHLDALGMGPGRAAPAPQGGSTAAESIAGTRVLIVDDSEDSQALIEAALADTGAVLSFAQTRAAALDLISRGSFDLVLMDVHLPDGDGLEATRALRQSERERGAAPVPVVMLTADALPATIALAHAAGCKAHLAKPLARDALIDAVRLHRKTTEPFPTAAHRQRYLANRAQEAAAALEALRRGDIEAVETLGHNLRGNAAGYGFPRLGALGERIENAARARDLAMLGELIHRLASDVSAAGVAASHRPASGTHSRADDPVKTRARKGQGGR